jgi:hypothetical protein
MTMEDKDWLDRRLAADNYIPDEGFTARVVERLPAERASSFAARRCILAVAAFVAVCLAAAQVIPLFRALQQFVAHHSVAETLTGFISLTHQPFVLMGVGAGMTVLAFASIPLLRRWA